MHTTERGRAHTSEGKDVGQGTGGKQKGKGSVNGVFYTGDS